MNNRYFVLGALFAVASTAGAYDYRSDSGVSQNGLGLTQGGNMAWIKQFTVTGGNNQINGVSTTFGTPAFPGSSGTTAGQAFIVYVWRGTPTGAGVDAPTLLAQSNGSVLAASIDSDVFQTVAVNALVTGTSNFFIGASINHATGGFPAPLQTTGTGSYPILNDSWYAGSATANGFNPNNLTGGVGINLISGAGFPGNWLLRAEGTSDAVPEPMSMVAIAMGMGALALRRRKKA